MLSVTRHSSRPNGCPFRFISTGFKVCRGPLEVQNKQTGGLYEKGEKLTSQARPASSSIEKELNSVRASLAERLDVEVTLDRALKNPHTRGLALEMMFDLEVKYTKRFAAEVFNDATSTGGHFDLARDLLARIQFDEASDLLTPLVDERLATEDHTWEAYLRLAEVLGELCQAELLDYVVARARTSNDPDVVMTAEMFDRGGFTKRDRVALREQRGGRPF